MRDDVEVLTAIYRLGGVASRRALVERTSRPALERALSRGTVVRDAHGRYAVPAAAAAVRAAGALSGTASHRSAATWWGWEQKCPDHDPEVTVPRHRKVRPDRRRGLTVHWADLSDSQVDGPVTTPQRTLVDCLRRLPFDEALAIADSALRHGSLTSAGLVALAAGVAGPGAAKCRRVAGLADARAANPFESVLRALSLSVRGLRLVPQVPITTAGRTLHPDLVDANRRLVVEADSFEWHGSRRALRRDCRRYNALVLQGWVVLRFTWEDVMHDPAYVCDVLGRATHADRLAQPAATRRRAA
ncbi:MAG TPA: DUF559 domain-containing protein [Nocardioidaceae bacterium]|nr:DUF559 domain-containing protein [Nocardioidaceae bacterium]